MRKAKVFFINSLAVAGVGLVLRFAAMAYNVYISGKLGAEGMGLLTLITSVYALAVTFASSGVGLTCTRLVAESLSLNNRTEARRSFAGCAAYALFFGALAFAGLFSLAGFLGEHVLHEERAALCLRALCPALPAAALSSCCQGYLTAVRKAYKSSVISVFEQSWRILLTALSFSLLAPKGKAVEAVLCSSALSEILSFLSLFVLVAFDRKKNLKPRGAPLPALFSRICGISLPIAAASWVRSALVTAEHVLVPRGLQKYGDPSALGTYGIMHGMALPVVFFPYAVLTPFTQLLIPEISRFKAQGDGRGISFTATLTLRLTLLFAFGCGAYICAFGSELGQALYGIDGVGRAVALFALLIPVMYLDTSVDAILKGLGEQFYCMRVNVGDAALSLVCVLTLVPRFGADGFLYTVFISESFNTVLSFIRLKNRTQIALRPFFSVALPALCAAAAGIAVKALPLSFASLPLSLVLSALLFLALYLFLLLLFGAIGKADRRYGARLIRGK